MESANHDQTKVIRFYSTGARDTTKPMDFLTIENLHEAGFVRLRYKGAKDPKTLTFALAEDPNRLVHRSVPPYDSASGNNVHPILRHELGKGWGAQWGAIYFPIHSEVALWRFMEQFDYPLPIDQQTNEKAT